jgi:hypothetical protein
MKKNHKPSRSLADSVPYPTGGASLRFRPATYEIVLSVAAACGLDKSAAADNLIRAGRAALDLPGSGPEDLDVCRAFIKAAAARKKAIPA